MGYALVFLAGIFAGPAFRAYVWPKIKAWWDAHSPMIDDDSNDTHA